MDVPLCWHDALESSANIWLPGYGHRAVRRCLLGDCSPTRVQLGSGSRGIQLQDSGAIRRIAVDRERHMAARFGCHVRDKRLDLVGAIRIVPLRCVAGVQGRLDTRIIYEDFHVMMKVGIGKSQ